MFINEMKKWNRKFLYIYICIRADSCQMCEKCVVDRFL